jgi:complement component 1 Q subcomponent-binding protein
LIPRISVIFSISDANSIVEEEEFDELEGEEVKIEKENKEETEAVKEQVEEEGDDDESFPVRALVRIEKKGKGDLLLSTIAQDGYLHIQGVRYFKEGQADLEDLSKDIGEQRQDLYMGPVFDELDEDLQVTFSKYLEERGIDTALATFLPDYIDYKEQKEYVNWLKDVNDFVSA